MTQHIAHDGAGRILFLCDCPDGLTPMPRDGRVYRAWPEPFSLTPPTPTQVAFFIDDRPQWVELGSLDDARVNAWTAAKKARDEAEAADFEFAGTLYQPDVAKITGAVLAALLPRAEGDPFAIDWTVSNNSVVTLSAQQVMSLGLALTARINAIHQRGRELRALIENAMTPAEAYGYTWNSLDA